MITPAWGCGKSLEIGSPVFAGVSVVAFTTTETPGVPKYPGNCGKKRIWNGFIYLLILMT
jgi:hypothetical protein